MTAPGPASRPRGGMHRVAALVALALTLGVTAWVFWESQRLIRADFASTAARQQVVKWVAGAESPPSVLAWESARDAIERAVEITPDDPAMHDVRGDVYAVAGSLRWFNALQRQAYYRQAIDSYRKSLQLRPTDPQTWASLAAAYYGARVFGAPLQEAWVRALALGPHEGHVQPMLMDLALATWPDASPDMQKWVEDTFESAPESTRIEINKMSGDVIDVGLFYTRLLEIGNWIKSDQATGRITQSPAGKTQRRPSGRNVAVTSLASATTRISGWLTGSSIRCSNSSRIFRSSSRTAMKSTTY